MKKTISLILITLITMLTIMGCAKETSKVNIPVKTTEKETDSEATEEVTTVVEDTTTENEEVTTEKEIITTVEQTTTEVITTTKKEPATTKKEPVTTKKAEETTKKEQVTTTKKEEQTTVKIEETTTEKTTGDTWFEKQGYELTPKSQVTRYCGSTDKDHDCGGQIYTAIEEPYFEYESEYKKVVFGVLYTECYYNADAEFDMIIFDKYTGIVISRSTSEFEFKGKKIKITYGFGGGSYRIRSVECPVEYDGLIFMVIPNSAIIYNYDTGIHTGNMLLTEAFEFDLSQCYFIEPTE